MTDFFFHFSALSVLPFWVMMICFPNRNVTIKLAKSPYIILPPALCYLGLLLPNFTLDFFVNPSPEKLAGFLSEPWAASLYWSYAGAFDLFVGRWIFFDAREREISHAMIFAPMLVCIFFGPLGLLMYFLTRLFQKREATA